MALELPCESMANAYPSVPLLDLTAVTRSEHTAGSVNTSISMTLLHSPVSVSNVWWLPTSDEAVSAAAKNPMAITVFDVITIHLEDANGFQCDASSSPSSTLVSVEKRPRSRVGRSTVSAQPMALALGYVTNYQCCEW
jgi:hypothetical protein